MRYLITEWDGKWRGAIHLHGHSHNESEYNQNSIAHGLLRFNVGINANDYRPISEEGLFELVRQAEENMKSYGSFNHGLPFPNMEPAATLGLQQSQR